MRFDSRDEVPEELRGEVTENEDGTFSIDLDKAREAGWGFENVRGLKSAKDKQQSEAENLRRRQREIEEKLGGKSIDDLLRARDQGKSESELLRQRVDELEARDRKRDAEARQSRYQSKLKDAIAEHKGEVGLLLPYLEARCMEAEDGRIVPRDAPEMTLSDYVGSLSKDPVAGRLFEGNQRSGIGQRTEAKPARNPKVPEVSREDLAHGRVDPQDVVDGKVTVAPSE